MCLTGYLGKKGEVHVSCKTGPEKGSGRSQADRINNKEMIGLSAVIRRGRKTSK